MTTPDLAALRALVEAVSTTLPRSPRLPHAASCGCDNSPHRRGWDEEREVERAQWHTSLGPIWTTAQAALERMENEPNPERTRAVMLSAGWKETNRQLEVANARLAQLEEALLKYGQHGPRCPIWATQTRGTCTCGLDAALEGRDE